MQSRFCTNLTDLLTRLGVQDQIRYHDTLHFLDGDGVRSVQKLHGIANKTGGSIAPNFNITSLSKTLGAVGGNVSSLNFNPSDFFDASAKLFGVISHDLRAPVSSADMLVYAAWSVG